jgi:hypothetical protein
MFQSMRTIGSLTPRRSLLNAGLADRFRAVMFPRMALSAFAVLMCSAFTLSQAAFA